jgi:hypothetical protein
VVLLILVAIIGYLGLRLFRNTEVSY